MNNNIALTGIVLNRVKQGNKMAMELSGRQARIAEMVRDLGFVAVDMLADKFEVTSQTIRRDINTLSERGLARRRHGGIERLPDHSNLSFSTRKILNLQAKRAIASEVAKHVQDGASIAISIGTTPAVVTEALLQHDRLSIFTNNMNVAMVGSRNPNFQVHIAGGQLRNHDLDVLGSGMESFFSSYKVDIGLYGVGGVDDDGTLLDFSKEEVRARQLIQQNCRSSYLVLDASKFGRSAHVRGGNICDATRVFCDRKPPADIKKAMKLAGTEFIRCKLEAVA